MKKILFTLLFAVIGLALNARSIDLSQNESANCYMVKAGKAYSFRVDIKGNGVETLGHSAVIDITTIKGVKVLWEDRDIVDNSSLKLNGSYLIFNTVRTSGSGNAVIGVFSDKECSDGKCLWSWHIWLTDASQMTIGGYTFLDRNLGAYDIALGDNGENGCWWQWGRKDPFPSDFSVGISVAEGKKSYDYSVANPVTFIKRNGRWMDVDAGKAWRNEGKKTMFDPCPPGYCVPVYEDILAIKMSGVEIDLPKAGAIWYDLDPSGLKMLSRAGFYWTSSLSEGSRSRSIDFYVYEDKTGLKSEYCNASGFSIRPQKINNKQ